MLIGTRMMLLNTEDRAILEKADILRRVLASLYSCDIDTPLVATFLTYWNTDGQTLVTSQGQMGYPLNTISDMMGIPIIGRSYEEFIPSAPITRGCIGSLYAIYAGLCHVDMKPGPGLVTISHWTDHFIDDQANSLDISSSDGFADPADPLFQELNFQVETQNVRSANCYARQPTIALQGRILAIAFIVPPL